MTAKKRRKSKVDANAVSVGSTALLGLLADIRAAVGDPNGRLMQDELVEHCRNLLRDRNRLLQSLRHLIARHEEEMEGGEPISGEEWEIAGYALRPNKDFDINRRKKKNEDSQNKQV